MNLLQESNNCIILAHRATDCLSVALYVVR